MKKLLIGLLIASVSLFATEVLKMYKYNDKNIQVIVHTPNKKSIAIIELKKDNSSKLTISQLKNIIRELKKDGYAKVLIDLNVSTLKDYTEIELLKKKLEFSENKVSQLSKLVQ